MARKMTEWPSKRGPITKIMPSDGCIGDTVPLAVGKWYDFHEFGWYMGNVGLSNSHINFVCLFTAQPLINSVQERTMHLTIIKPNLPNLHLYHRIKQCELSLS